MVEIKEFDSWTFAPGALELVSNKYIDGYPVSDEEFERRTAAPIELTIEEIEAELGYKIKLK